MPEETLFATESHTSRKEIADYLRTVADRLEGGEELTLSAADQSITLSVPDRPAFEVSVEREYSESGGSDEYGLEMELEWSEDDTESGLSIE